MERGILTAAIVTAAWIAIQILWMHVKPTENRFKAMLLGYVLSLPFVIVAFEWLPGLAAVPLHEPWGIGLFFAYFLHLLLFFLYVECFYHVERSVTLRFLVEILQRCPEGTKIEDVLGHYNVKHMVQTRLDVLGANGFIEARDGNWYLTAKGRRFARLMAFSSWLFQSTVQSDRI